MALHRCIRLIPCIPHMTISPVRRRTQLMCQQTKTIRRMKRFVWLLTWVQESVDAPDTHSRILNQKGIHWQQRGVADEPDVEHYPIRKADQTNWRIVRINIPHGSGGWPRSQPQRCKAIKCSWELRNSSNENVACRALKAHVPQKAGHCHVWPIDRPEPPDVIISDKIQHKRLLALTVGIQFVRNRKELIHLPRTQGNSPFHTKDLLDLSPNQSHITTRKRHIAHTHAPKHSKPNCIQWLNRSEVLMCPSPSQSGYSITYQ